MFAACGFSSLVCRSREQAQKCRRTGLAARGRVEPSRTKDGPRVPEPAGGFLSTLPPGGVLNCSFELSLKFRLVYWNHRLNFQGYCRCACLWHPLLLVMSKMNLQVTESCAEMVNPDDSSWYKTVCFLSHTKCLMETVIVTSWKRLWSVKLMRLFSLLKKRNQHIRKVYIYNNEFQIPPVRFKYTMILSLI